MKSSDHLLEAIQTPLLAMASSGGVLVLACHFGPSWFAGVMSVLFLFFTRSVYQRAVCWAGDDIVHRSEKRARTTTRAVVGKSTEARHSHYSPWLLCACCGLHLFVQPHDCVAERHLGASVAASPVVACGVLGSSSLENTWRAS